MSISKVIALNEHTGSATPETPDRAADTRSEAHGDTRLRDAAADGTHLNQVIDTVCERIAPLWPLKSFVAVNPFFGLRARRFQEAAHLLARVAGARLYMPREYYREQRASGRISRRDIELAIARCGSALDPAAIDEALTRNPTPATTKVAPVTEILDRVEGANWTPFVIERISLLCAAYFDLGQATIPMPWRDGSLYQAWRRAASIDRSPAMMGLGRFRDDVAALPAEPRAAIAWALTHLEVPAKAAETYLHATLLSIGGWAAWSRYLRWQAELTSGNDDSIVDLLAIRVCWDALLMKAKRSPALVAHWRESLDACQRQPSPRQRAEREIDGVLLTAAEISYQRSVAEALRAERDGQSAAAPARPSVQAAFCIDVRSEVFRRSLETVAPDAQTLGFAGFFGIFIEYVPLGASAGRSHVPVIFNPAHRIYEQVKDAGAEANSRQAAKRRERMGLSKVWKAFKLSASSCFSFVEAAGLLYAPKLLGDSFGWSRPVPAPSRQGLDAAIGGRTGPALDALPEAQGCKHAASGIPEAERVDHAERILRAMSLTENFARLVLLAGHGSTSVNNPHATGLDCGACAGQTGEASARVVASLLNLPAVRQGLRERGIDVPDDTWFIAGLHDTTTDDVQLFDTEAVPPALSKDLNQLRQWLEQAGDLTRMQRATVLGTAALPDRLVEADVRRRSRDWSQVRPEWGLANNAAFIAAPRERTMGMNLAGRSFLHEYQWQNDQEFRILELIMTAPMVVANWINMQYYGSTVDNARFGSGNKVLHNVTGGAIGVLEGNGGDLRVGLSLQSLHDGKRWVHEPLRLSVFIEAPESAMDDIIARHELVRELIENEWLHLFRIDADGQVYRRTPDRHWQRFEA